MKKNKPRLPKITIKELEESSYEEYAVVIEVVRHAAYCLYNASPATNKFGLEGCMEVIISLLDKGLAKIVYNEDKETLYIGFYNPATGKYQAPAYFKKEVEEDELG